MNVSMCECVNVSMCQCVFVSNVAQGREIEMITTGTGPLKLWFIARQVTDIHTPSIPAVYT